MSANVNNNDHKNKSEVRQIKSVVDSDVRMDNEVPQHHHKANDNTASKLNSSKKPAWWLRLFKFLLSAFAIIIVSFFIIINLQVTKTYIANQALQLLNKNFKASMSTGKVEVNFFGDVIISHIRIKDYKANEFVKIKKFRAGSDWFSLIAKLSNINFRNISFEQADIKIVTYKGDSLSNFQRYIKNFESDKKKKKGAFDLSTRLSISQSKILILNQNKDGDDGKWLDASDFNLILSQLKVHGADVFATIQNANFSTNRYGIIHKLNTLTGQFSLTRNALQVSNLVFFTDRTLLNGSILLKLKNRSFANFVNEVPWEMKLNTGSYVSGTDISYFLKTWDSNSTIDIQGEIDGPLNNFVFKDAELSLGSTTLNTKEIAIQNLFSGALSLQTKKVSANFFIPELQKTLPGFLSQKLEKVKQDFGRIQYSGSLDLDPKNLHIARAYIIAGLGRVAADYFSINGLQEDNPNFMFKGSTNNLDVGRIISNKNIGNISGDFKLKGKSFDIKKMRMETFASIKELRYGDFLLQNLNLKGLLERMTYTGDVIAKGSAADFSTQGFFDFSSTKAGFYADFNANINKLNLGGLLGKKDLLDKNLAGKYKAKVRIKGSDVLEADITANGMVANFGNNFLNLPLLDVKIQQNYSSKNIVLNTPGFISGNVNGNFEFSQLGGILEAAKDKIISGPLQDKRYFGVFLKGNLKVEQEFLQSFLTEAQLSQPLQAQFEYTGNSNDIFLQSEIPSLDVLLTDAQSDKLEKALTQTSPITGNTDPIQINNRLVLKNASVFIDTKSNDTYVDVRAEQVRTGNQFLGNVEVLIKKPIEKINERDVDIKFQYAALENNTIGDKQDYHFSFLQNVDKEGNLVFNLQTNSLVYNGVHWNFIKKEGVDNTNQIIYKKGGRILAKNILLESNGSKLFIDEANIENGQSFTIKGKVEQFQVSTLFQTLNPKSESLLEGIANGDISIISKNNNMIPVMDLTVQDIQVNSEEIGNMKVNISGSDRPNVFTVKAFVDNKGLLNGNALDVEGTISAQEKKLALDLGINLKEFNVAFANQFVQGVFSNLRGYATGLLKLQGSVDDLDYSGDLKMTNLGLKLNFTGVDYRFDDTDISISKGLATIAGVGVRDGRNASAGTLSGSIQFETLNSLAINMILSADNLLLLNTSQQDYDLFWGRVSAKGDLYVSGPVSQLSIETPNMKVLPGSVFTFNSNSTSTVDKFKMLRFVQDSTALATTTYIKDIPRKSNLGLDFTVDIDKGSVVNVLIGDGIGDISVRGAANGLNFRMNRQGNIAMNGEFLVDNGQFVSKAILSRTFQITKNSSIRWDGNALTPALDIDATYLRMVSNAGEYLDLGKLPPVSIQLVAKIGGYLNDPKLDLDVQVPDGSSQIKETLSSRLALQDEKVVQFGSILALNKFNVNGVGGLNINVGSTLQSSATDLIFKQLGTVFNTISNEFQVDLNYIMGDDATNTGDRANAGVNFTISPRVTLKTGLGIPLSKTQIPGQDYLSGEGIIEYDWSKNNDGSRIFRVYSKPSNIGLGGGINAGNPGANQSWGAGVVYSKSFKTILKKRKKSIPTNRVKEDSILIRRDSTK